MQVLRPLQLPSAVDADSSRRHPGIATTRVSSCVTPVYAFAPSPVADLAAPAARPIRRGPSLHEQGSRQRSVDVRTKRYHNAPATATWCALRLVTTGVPVQRHENALHETLRLREYDRRQIQKHRGVVRRISKQPTINLMYIARVRSCHHTQPCTHPKHPTELRDY